VIIELPKTIRTFNVDDVLPNVRVGDDMISQKDHSKSFRVETMDKHDFN